LKISNFTPKLTFQFSLSSAENIVDISKNILTSFKQRNPDEKSQQSPMIINCLTGAAERSGMITIGICAITATQMKKPILLSELKFDIKLTLIN
jgi:hypothetical protein